MKKMKRLSLFITILLFMLPFTLSVRAAEESYYIAGSFNNNELVEEYKMTLNSDNNYEYIFTNRTEYTQFRITDGENSYRTEGLNKGASFLLKEKGQYKILFNKEPILDGKNTSITRLEDKSYYVMGSINNELNDTYKMKYVDYGKYEYLIDINEYTLIYISDGENEYRSSTGDDYVISEEGRYKLEFTINDSRAKLNITPYSEEIKDYYVLGSFNGFIMDEDSLMERDGGNLSFRLDTVNSMSFYISDGEKIYRNDKVDYLIKEGGSYNISFNESNKLVKIEELDYYILSSDNGFTMDPKYKLEKTTNKLYLEYKYSITIDEPYQFVIGSSQEEFTDNEGSFLIKEKGQYNIYFSPSHKYENGTNALISKYKEDNNSFYLMGSFNSYEKELEYKLQYNDENKDYIEYTIDLDLMKGDSFYITGNGKDYYNPNGDELVADNNATYRIYFSPEYDYGNGYSIYYRIIKNEDIEEREITISNKGELIDFINKANMDSFSTNLTVEIKNDIDMENEIIPSIAIFSGVLNGNFHVIRNFRLDTTILGSEIGFIRRLLPGASVNNLSIEYSLKLDSNTELGGIVGFNEGTIRNSSFSGSLEGLSVVGGITARNAKDAKIINSSSEGSIVARSFVGGIAGINNGSISKSYSYTNINKTIFSSSDERKIMNIGGIVGFNANEIDECYNRGSVGTRELGGFVGGIAGNSTGIIKNSYNLGFIQGKKYVGGIVGYYALLKNNNEGNIYDDIIKEIEDILNGNDEEEFKVEKPEVKVKGSLSACYNKGRVEATSSAGGIAGFVSSEGTRGDDSYNVKLCYNMGDVKTILSYAGGIAGEHALGTISECYNVGMIESEKDYAGGIAGSSGGVILASFNISIITAKSYVGGICGYGNEISNTYSITSIHPDGSHIGAIAGSVNSVNEKIINNYYIDNGYKAIDNIDYDNKGMEAKREDLASKGILRVDLDFKYFMAGADVESYPILKNMVNIDSALKETFKKDIYDNNEFSCEISFVDDDGTILYVRKVKYGEDFDLALLPEPKSKDGFISKWDPSFTGKSITEDTIVKIVYREIRSSIGSDATNKPEAIIEGSFSPTTKLEVEKTNNNYLGDNSMYKYVATYKFKVSDENESLDLSNIVVNLNVNGNDKAIVALVKDGKTIFIDSSLNGDYLRFSLDDTMEFMIVEKEFYNLNNSEFVRIVAYSTVGVLAAIIVLSGAYIVISSRRKEKHL